MELEKELEQLRQGAQRLPRAARAKYQALKASKPDAYDFDRKPAMPLVAEGASGFSVTGVPARGVFVMDEAACRATSRVLHQGGREMPTKRTE